MQPSKEENIGTLWRSAYIMGASFVFTIDKKYKKQSSDVVTTPSRIPLFHYSDIHDLKSHLPYGAPLIGIEMTEDAVFVSEFKHPMRAVYILGNEKNGLSKKTIDSCHAIIKLPGDFSLNVAATGSIVMHDRISKITHTLPQRTLPQRTKA